MHRGDYHYAAACKQARNYIQAISEDPMSRFTGAPVDDIIEGWMRTHVKACEACKEATFEANMP